MRHWKLCWKEPRILELPLIAKNVCLGRVNRNSTDINLPIKD